MNRVRFSEEEKIEDYKDVEIMLRAGWSYTRMSEEIGRSRQYCCDIKKDLVHMGKITQKEIDDAKNKARNQKNQELDEIVYQSLSSGKNKNYIKKISCRQMKDINDSIERIKDTLAEIDTRSEEEKARENKLKVIKDLVLDDKSLSEINQITGYPTTTIERYIKKLIDSKEISKNDVKNAKLEQKKRNQERNEKILALIEFNVPYKIIAAIFDLTVEAIYQIKNKYSELSEEEKLRDEKILALIEFNVPYKIISAIFNLSINVIVSIKNRHYGIKRRVSKGTKRKKVEINEVDDNLTEMEIDIIKYLKDGYSYTYIGKKKNTLQKDLMEIIKNLKLKRYISQTIINEAHKNRSLYYRNIIMALYNDGAKQADIYRHINKDDVEELSNAYISRTINKLRCEGLIDDDKVKQSRDDSPESFASIDSRVMALLVEGLVVKEMIESDETGVLTESRVRRSKARLIAAGKITEKEIIKYQNRRKKRIREEENIWYYLENYGLANDDIAKHIGLSPSTVCLRVKSYAKRKKLSDKDLKNIRKQALLSLIPNSNKESVDKKDEQREVIAARKVAKKFTEKKNNFLKWYNKSIPSNLINKAYYNCFMELSNFGYDFNKQDIDILCYVVLYTVELFNEDNISLVIFNYLYIKEFERAEHTLNYFVSFNTNRTESDTFKQQMMKNIINCKNGKEINLRKLI